MGCNVQGFNHAKHEADAELKAIALRIFGTRDSITPIFPRSGELIQEAMEHAYDLGKKVKVG